MPLYGRSGPFPEPAEPIVMVKEGNRGAIKSKRPWQCHRHHFLRPTSRPILLRECERRGAAQKGERWRLKGVSWRGQRAEDDSVEVMELADLLLHPRSTSVLRLTPHALGEIQLGQPALIIGAERTRK